MGDVRDGLSAGNEIASLTRRRILQGAGAFLGTTVIPPVSKEAPAANLPLQGSRKPASADITTTTPLPKSCSGSQKCYQ